MTVSLQRLDQLHKPDTFDDLLSAATLATLESTAVDFADFQEGYLSQLKRIIYGDDAGNWYDDIATAFSRVASLKELASKTPLDEKLVLRWRLNLTDLSAVPASAQHVLLDAAGEPPADVIAIAATTQGAVSAQLAGAVGSPDLTEISGSNALKPKNLVSIFDGATGDAITSSGRRVYGLLQVGTAATDGNSFSTSGNDQGQITFVRANETFDDLELVTAGDMDGKVVIYAFTRRKDIDSMSEDEFRGDLDQADPAAGVTVSLDAAYDGGNFITADGSDIDFRLADTVNFNVRKTPGGGTLLFQVARDDGGTDLVQIASGADLFDVDAADTDFAQGVSLDTADQTINLGKTAVGVIDSTTIELRSTTGDAEISGADDVLFQTVRETTAIPLDDATAGAISGLFGGSFASISAAIKWAGEHGGADFTLNVFVSGANFAQDANVAGASLDLSTYSIDMNTPANTTALVFLNGRLLHGGNGTTQNDVYAGDTPASGDLKFDFAKGIKTGDVILTVGLLSGSAT